MSLIKRLLLFVIPTLFSISSMASIDSVQVFTSDGTGCYDSCNGYAYIEIYASSSIGPFRVVWDGDSLSAPEVDTVYVLDSLTNLCEGNYSVTVTDLSDGFNAFPVYFSIQRTDPIHISFDLIHPSCHRDSNGWIEATPSGGNGVYRYAWTGFPIDTNARDSLTAGVYILTVTDTLGCTNTDSTLLVDPDSLAVNISGIDVTCKDFCDGQVAANPTGGNGIYSYLWNNSATDRVVENLCPGTFFVTVTDSNGCVGSDTISITEPDSVVVTYDITNAQCSDSCDAQIIAHASGGIGPYNYQWAGYASTDSMLNNVCAGLVTVSVYDQNGCYITNNVSPTKPDPIQANDSVFSSDCGDSNGVIKLFPTGGNGDYSFAWLNQKPGDTLSELDSLKAGIYTVTISDSSGCSSVFNFNLSNDTSGIKDITFVSNSSTCADSCDGWISATASGGVPPYNYSWSSGGSDSLETGLCPGIYTLTVVDGNGCIRIESYALNSKSQLSGYTKSSQTSCVGECDGEASVIVNAGQAPYTYTWLNSTSTGSSAANLCAGQHPVEVIDAYGCSFRDTAVVVSNDTLKLSLTPMNANCAELCNGSINAVVSGGQAPYSYAWSNGENGSSLNSLCSGTYTLTVTDAAGCSVQESVSINVLSSIVSNAMVFNASCNNANGSISLTPSGGTGLYTYRWFNNTFSDSVYGLNSGGPYGVEIMDASGCSVTDSFYISDVDGPVITANITDEACYGDCNGSIQVSVIQGNASFSYHWQAPIGSNASSSVSGLCPGQYPVIVEDQQGCKTAETFTISGGAQLSSTHDITPPSCNGSCDGIIVVNNVTGGVPPYTTTKTFAEVCGGIYNYDIIDVNGCKITQSVEVPEPAPLDIQLLTSNLTCHDRCDGKVEAMVTGGNGVYTYRWSTGATGSSIDNLCEGTYILEVTDSNGCYAVDTIGIGNGPAFNASFNSTDADCGLCNGSLSVSISGGNGVPYSYRWSTGDTISTASDLSAGIYKVWVTDNQGCEQEFEHVVNNSGGPGTSDTVLQNLCVGDCDATAVSMASGTAPLFVQWYDPAYQQGDSAKALCEGKYRYSVTDSLGCVTFDSVVVTDPEDLKITSTVTLPSCAGDDNASIAVNVSGGAPNYNYLWSTGDTVNSIDSITAGTYWVQVTDTNGCVKSDTFDLIDPDPLSIDFDVVPTTCFNVCDGVATAFMSGGTGPYSYDWTGIPVGIFPVVSNLCAGYQLITVRDANACEISDSVLITSPSAISVTPTLNNPSCNGGNDGNVTLSPNGGLRPYSFMWSTGQRDSIADSLSAGVYSVILIDSSSCVYHDTFTLIDPSPLNVTPNLTPPTCNTGNGAASVTVSGGSGSYGFVWNTIPTQTGSAANNLWAGIYEVTISDQVTGCTQIESIVLNDNGGPALSDTSFNESCPSACDGEANVRPGPGKFIFEWSHDPNLNDSIATGLCAGTYTVKVTDTTTYCVSFDTIVVLSDTFSTTILSVLGVDCYGDCDGEATIVAMGGTAPIDYSWNSSPSQTTQTASNLCGGVYIGVATDSNNCSSSQLVVISEPDSISIDMTIINDALCFDECNGAARINISGGTGPYVTEWDGVRGSTAIATLCPGSHTVEVIDFNGCSKVLNFDIQNATAIDDGEVISPPNCGKYDGSITLNPSGGLGPYNYQWSDGSNNSELNNLFAGIYAVVITDMNGCSQEFTYFVNNQSAPVLQFDMNTVKCNGDCNGVARVTPQGGVSPYSYLWDHVPISTNDSLTDLCSGSYFVKVTDAQGCVAFGADTVSEPPVLDGTLTKLSDGCGGACDGEAEMTPAGGTPPYSYTWQTVPPQSGSSVNNLCAGTFTVLLTDNNDCLFEDSVTITPPPPLVIDSIESTDASCVNNRDGEATVFASGGTTPYNYDWSDAQTTQTASNLGAGKYYISVTDDNNCTVDDSVLIGVLDSVVVIAFVDSFVCEGETTSLIAGGFGATQFNWFEDSAGVLIPLLPAEDSISYTVTDSIWIVLRGQSDATTPCVDFDSAYINAIPPPVIDAGSDVTIEEGEFTQLLVSPFLFNGSYAWSPSEGLNDTAAIDPIARPEVTTTYVVIGTNQFGCSDRDTVTVNVVENRDVINGFSPNSDGVNDTWELPFLSDYPNAIVEVYNRWGLQVFRAQPYDEPWDGTFEGSILPSASYYYIIDYLGDGTEVVTGAVTILY